MKKNKDKWIVVTDLDGTLLNHHNYEFDSAIPIITTLQDLNIPIILNTSKTFSECVDLQDSLNLDEPFIVENGSCIFYPKSKFKQAPKNTTDVGNYWSNVIGNKKNDIHHILCQIETPNIKYILLSESTVHEAIELTGLSETQAKQAIARDYSEPLIWLGNTLELTTFRHQLTEHNLNLLQGGRFLHVLGNCNKGIATQIIKENYRRNDNDVKAIVLGDSENDADMLLIADIKIIINSPSNDSLLRKIKPDILTVNEAPTGWADAITTSLERINNS